MERRHRLRGIFVVGVPDAKAVFKKTNKLDSHGQCLMSFFLPPFSFWMQGQPDNWGDEPGEDCGQVVGYNYGHWKDENCDVERKYICKHINRECRIRARRPTGHR